MEQIDKKLIIDNGFWKVFQTYFKKQGKKGNVLTMEKNKNSEGVFILPLTKEMQLVYLKEFKFGPNEYQLCIPAGGVENKSIKETAEDELLEETGYKAEKMIYLGKYNHNNYISGKIHLYLGLNCEKVQKQDLQDIEEIEVFKNSIDGFEKMIENNEIYCPWTELTFRKAKEKTKNFTEFNF